MIDVQVVAYGKVEDLKRALSSIPRDRVSKITVVDHRGNVPRQLPGLADEVIVDPANPGFGAGHNRALGRGSAPYVLLLNPDAELEDTALQDGLAVLEVSPKAAAVQGVIRDRRTGAAERSQGVEPGPLHLWGRALGLRALLRFGFVRSVARRIPLLADHVDRVPTEVAEVASLAATALLLRRAALEEVGGFDERYFLYGEDLDLCRRLRVAGWELLAAPFPFAVHTGGGSAAGWAEREMQWWVGTLRFARRWWGSPATVAAEGAAVVMAVRLGWRGGPARVVASWRALRSGGHYIAGG